METAVGWIILIAGGVEFNGDGGADEVETAAARDSFASDGYFGVLGKKEQARVDIGA